MNIKITLIVFAVYIALNIIVVLLYKLYLNIDYKKFVRKEKMRLGKYIHQLRINSL